MVALSQNFISVQPCVDQENKKREKAEFIIFREIKVTGNILVIQYVVGGWQEMVKLLSVFDITHELFLSFKVKVWHSVCPLHLS